jgi:hypothetical protein
MYRSKQADSSSKKVSLFAFGREENQKKSEKKGLEFVRERQIGAVRRDAGRASVISQNWHAQTSAFFAVLSN